MGHKQSRARTRSSGGSSSAPPAPASGAAGGDAARASGDAASEPEEPRYPFRCEDRSKIPDDIVEGPFEDFEIANDVYSTAYLIARNSGDMYSIWPWKNRDMLIVWMFLLFTGGSQLFVILSVTFWYPPTVATEHMTVVCSNATAVAEAFGRGFLPAPNASDCFEAGKYAFEADLRGVTVQHYTLERSTRYFDSILKEGDGSIYVLRLICCIWVFSQVYLQEFTNVQSLLLYHDFSCWFLPLKGEPIRNAWAACIPLIQYFVILVVATVSFVIICAQAEAFDIVMNSLAFTFIAEVGSFFNGPLSKRMGATLIKNLPADDYPDPVFYLYPEYDSSNALYEDGKYTDGGWYILEEEQKAGMLNDYKIRHNPAKYPHVHAKRIGRVLELALFLVPVLVVITGTIRCHWPVASPAGAGRSDL